MKPYFLYINQFLQMSLNKDKCVHLIQKMKFEQKKVIQVWQKQRNLRDSLEKNKVKKFLIAFCPNINLTFFSSNKRAVQILESFLNDIVDLDFDQTLTQDLYGQQIEKLRSKLQNLGQWADAPVNVNNPPTNKIVNKIQSLPIPNEPNEGIIDGRQIQINIVLNNKRMDTKYSYYLHQLRNYFEKFVKLEIVQTKIKVGGQKKSVRILYCKSQFKDNYTGSYVFDPFFNSVKIFIKKKDGSFLQGNFIVQNPNNITIRFQENSDYAYWIDQSDFQLNDNVNILINYICQKQNADESIKKKLKDDLKEHGYRTIKDLMYNTKQSLDKVIFQNKWKNEILSEVQKIRGSTRKSFTGNQSISEDKKKCRRIGNSHKILRYLFYKVCSRENAGKMEDEFLQRLRSQKSLKQLNKTIPKINHGLMLNVIGIVQQQLMIEDLFSQLRRYFKYFTQIPDKREASKFQHPYGVLFYGPPGTGKTRLTQDLAELMGFHLVSHGLSSAQFMKELVGQAKGTVHSYLRRAQVSKHLICSLAIDQIDAIVGDRRKQNSKGSQETVAMFLSALGGNQAIENILVFGSTNFRNLIDDAILRRLTPDFYVRLPSRQDRKKIVKKLLPSLQTNEGIIEFIVSITPNYSGAAMKLLCQKYSLYKQQRELSKHQLIQIATEVAISYKIKFGDETYPQIYDKIQKQISLNLIKSTNNNILIIQKLQKNGFRVHYCQKQKKWVDNQLITFNQLKHADFKLAESGNVDYQKITSWVLSSLINFKLSNKQPQIIDCNENQLKQKMSTIQSFNEQIIFLVKGRGVNSLKDISFENINPKFVNIIYYFQGVRDKDIVDAYGRFIYKKIFTGRVLVDLTSVNTSSMIFQLKKTESYPKQIERRPFFQNKKVSLSKDALPEIVQFLMSKEVQYIQMINAQLLHDNNAFVQNDIHTVITSKIDQAKQYKKSSIIIDLSSLILINKNVSEASTGNTTSKNISQPTLYHKLVDLIKNFAVLQQKMERWIFVIVEDVDLMDMLKKDVKIAPSPQEEQQKFEIAQKERIQKLKKQPRRCIACRQIYNHQQNEKQKSCKQHYGLFVDDQQFKLITDETKTLQQIRFQQKKFNIGIKEDKHKHKFLYSCCWKEIDAQGCREFQHWSGAALQEQIQHVSQLRQKIYQSNLWQRQCRQFIQAFKRYIAK